MYEVIAWTKWIIITGGFAIFVLGILALSLIFLWTGNALAIIFEWICEKKQKIAPFPYKRYRRK